MAKKQKSKPERWAEAVEAARVVVSELLDARARAVEAFEAIKEIQGEYETWADNTPDSLKNGTLGDKLQAVVEFDLDAENMSPEEMETAVEEAAALDLPLGFGRD